MISILQNSPPSPGAGLIQTVILFTVIGAILYLLLRRKRTPSAATKVTTQAVPTYHPERSFRLHLVNPTNGVRRQTIPFLWTLIFGGFYFIAHGIWTHALISIVLAIPTFGVTWLIYPFFAKSIVLNHYLKMGWVEAPEYERMINEGIAPSTWLGTRQPSKQEPERQQLIKVRCGKCSSLNDENSKFCSSCGNPLIQQPTAG